ncbi:hypothetical protein MN608_06527 [Microdochium nivale]|nr:hypothetical protein MN608_06527 [Microdochium nivale]
MDDPWGSPWGEPSSKTNPAPLDSPSSLLGPPPKAFFGATSPGASPWGNDAGGFGGWTEPSTDRLDDSPSSPSWGAWGEASPKRFVPPTQLDRAGRASPAAWPSSALPSPRLSPFPRSRNSSTRRPSATDPWAAELSHSLSKADDVLLSVPGNERRPQDPRDQIPPEGLGIYKNGTSIEPSSLPSVEQKAQEQSQDASSSPRPSIETSVGSTNTEEEQQSPITPAVEAKQCIAPVSRSVSGKVHDLVGMYDGLATTVIEEPGQKDAPASGERHSEISFASDPSAEHATSLHRILSDEDEDESNIRQPEPVLSVSTERLAETRAIIEPQSSTCDTETYAVFGEERPQKHSTAINEIVAQYGMMDFRPNLESFKNMFANISQPDFSSLEGPDPQVAVIKDSFREISERKTWYRISRFGSMRKHDLGDDENYMRVTWPVTKLHDDTIVIVRRWMEEDSFVGKSMLGWNKRASVFNWDSSAAPVDLSTIYAKKSSLEAGRPSTEGSALHAVHSSVSSEPLKGRLQDLSRGDQEPPAASPASIPAFGWSSTATKSSVSFAPPPPPPASGELKRPILGHQASPLFIAPVHPLVLATLEQPATTADGKEKDEDEEEDEDDDDWGDMVVSPGFENRMPVDLDSAFAPDAPTLVSTQPATNLVKPAPLADAWANDDFSLFESQASPAAGDDMGISTKQTTNNAPLVLTPTPLRIMTPPVPSVPASLADPKRTPPQEQIMKISTIACTKSPSSTVDPCSGADLGIAKAIVDNLPDLSYMLR